jgi:abortive infection bacteriophage resistance protein
MRIKGGFFIALVAVRLRGRHMSSLPPSVPYGKPWLSCSRQVSLLESRGLVITDGGVAEAFLARVNYYRFSGYCLAFESSRHRFRAGVTFDQIRDTYDFDRVLRDLVTEALESIEIDLRSAIAHYFGQHFGAFGHTNAASFFRTFAHTDWLNKLNDEAERSNELFVQHFRTNYREFPNLPIWIGTEVMSFGTLSLMFKAMHRKDQQRIAARYGMQAFHLQSWMHHFVYVRNLCAHHSRLWDRIWAIKPDLPPGRAWNPPLLPSNTRLFATLLILRDMLKRCPATSPFDQQWRARLDGHLMTPPQAPQALERMGLTNGWQNHPLWM